VIYELDGPGGTIIDDGYLDLATGKLVRGINLTGYADGVYTVTANEYDKAGNASAVVLSTPTITLDTVPPTGTFTVNGAPSNTALTNNPVVALALSFADDRAGLNLYRVSVDGGTTWTAWTVYAATSSVGLPAPDGTYNVQVQVADKAGNIFAAMQKVILDRTGPTIAPALNTPTNGTFYDVGMPITLTWTATDLNGVSSSIASIEGQTISASGGKIDVDVLTSGSHTVTITATDKAGNVSTKTIAFTIHATPRGIINAINDGVSRGWIGAAFASNLVSQMQQVIKALPSAVADAKAKLQQFISSVQYPGRSNPITPAFQSLLLNWANDLLGRM
jgi:hypothetical protein